MLFDRDGDTGRSLRNGKDTDSGFAIPRRPTPGILSTDKS